MSQTNKAALRPELVAKQDIKMPGRDGHYQEGRTLLIPKGTPFKWSPRTKTYVARMGDAIVASVNQSYVNKVKIFE